MYTAVGWARRRTTVSCSAWRLATALAAYADVLDRYGTDGKTLHELHYEV
jgi:hypothetical protein